jgi:hypothetical protein
MVEDVLRAAEEQMDEVLQVAARGLAALFPVPHFPQPAGEVAGSSVARRWLLDQARLRGDLANAALQGVRRDAEARIRELVEHGTLAREVAARAGNELRAAMARRVLLLEDLLERNAADLAGA